MLQNLSFSRISVTRKKCCVPNCPNATPREGTQLHHFPRNVNIGEKWLKNINNPLITDLPYEMILRNYRICSDHFEQSAFRTVQRTRLNLNVVPTIFFECSDGEEAFPSSPVSETYTISVFSAPIELSLPSSCSSTIVDTNSSLLPGSTLKPQPIDRLAKARRNARQFAVFNRRLKQAVRGRITRKKILAAFKETIFNSKKHKGYELEISSFLRNLSSSAVTFIVSELRRGYKLTKSPRLTESEKAICLSMYKTSPRCYRFLSKMLCLPSTRTLSRCIQAFSLKTGINDNLFQYLSQVSDKMNPMDRYCVLMFDEVRLQSHISISRQWRSVIGLKDLGKGRTKYIADRALVFMIRGINKKWKQPICYYFVRSRTKTSVLKSLIVEVIKVIHKKTKFVVLATVCDQSSANQSAMLQLSRESGHNDDFIFKINDVTDGNTVQYEIIHLFDPSNLIKCMRNHFVKKDIYFEDKVAKWSDIETLHQFDTLNRETKMVRKLTGKHLRPNGRDKLRVFLATQVFSRTIHAAFQILKNCGGWKCSPGTDEFILFMNKLFDSLNSVKTGLTPLSRPLTDGSFHKNFWLEAQSFLNSLGFKKGEVFLKSPPTVKNIIVTIRNVQSLWERMKGLGFKYLLTRTLNLDPLENFFGVIRGLSGQNYKPTCLQFVTAFKTCCVNDVRSVSLLTNCRDDGTHFLLSFLHEFRSSQRIPPVHPLSPSSTPSATKPKPVDYSKTVTSLRSYASTYIAGFIYRKYIKHGCYYCNRFFISDTCTDSHAFMHANEFGRRQYPTVQFIAVVDRFQSILIKEFIENINSSNLQKLLSSKFPDKIINVCRLHDAYNNELLKRCLTVIIIKKCCVLINRKNSSSKDLKRNSIFDDYLRHYGTKLKKV